LFRRLSVVCFAAALVGGCGGDAGDESSTELPATSLPGVYSGVFPCETCPGIPTTLWLRSDQRFFLKQEYTATEEHQAMNAYSLGRWSWQAEQQELVLSGAGPERRFTRPDANALVMQTYSALEHRLDRNVGSASFDESILMRGTMRPAGDGMVFSECLTGLAAPVRKGGDYRRFTHQYRSTAARGKPVFVELEGRFSWAADGAPQSVRIERFVTIKADATCRAAASPATSP